MFWKIQDRRQIKTDNTQIKHNSEKKQTMQNTAKQNYSGLVTFCNTQRRDEVGKPATTLPSQYGAISTSS